MTVSVKIINKTAALQIILLTGGQQLPIPPTDQGVTNTFDPEAEDDVMQMERLHKALTQPSLRQQITRGELVVEGFDQLKAAIGIADKKAEGDKTPARGKQPPAPEGDKKAEGDKTPPVEKKS